MKKTAILIVLLLTIGSPALAGNTINATSCNNTVATPHVQTAINSAQDGDTVVMPAGTCSWTSRVLMNKAIRLTGAGVDSTIITETTYAAGNTNERFGSLFSSYSAGMREIDNFQMRWSTGASNIRIEGGGRFWIHNMKFLTAPVGISVVSPLAGAYGLISDCYFTTGTVNSEVIHPFSQWSANEAVSLGWLTASTWADGTASADKALYVEDCTFVHNTGQLENMGHAIAGAGAARYVFRYNDTYLDVDAHGW